MPDRDVRGAQSAVLTRLLRSRDFYAGVLIIMMGLMTLVIAPTYGLGTIMRVGPGLFPTLLGLAMLIVGGMIIAADLMPKTQKEADEDDVLAALPKRMEWRGWSCVFGGPIAFVVLGEYFGLVPAAFGCVFVAMLGDRQSTLKEALVLSACVSAVGAFLFSYVMQLPFPVLKWGF